jgi:hypothetical protein
MTDLKFTTAGDYMKSSKCDTCGEALKENGVGCDWRQGRCPHRSPMFNKIVLDKYKMRFYNLMQTIKGWVK